jgi:hypothetical protein
MFCCPLRPNAQQSVWYSENFLLGSVSSKRPTFVTNITSENRHGYSDRMSNLRVKQGNPHRWQKVVRKRHTDSPGLQNSSQIHQNKKEGSALCWLLALLEYKCFCQYEGCNHACDVGKDYRCGKIQPQIIQNSGAKIDDGRCPSSQQKIQKLPRDKLSNHSVAFRAMLLPNSMLSEIPLSSG